ncbi:hypothetical protein PDJAM_G00259660 [Pangasius djambal]|nr:hypothetical protein [Pangasius djambal]
MMPPVKHQKQHMGSRRPPQHPLPPPGPVLPLLAQLPLRGPELPPLPLLAQLPLRGPERPPLPLRGPERPPLPLLAQLPLRGPVHPLLFLVPLLLLLGLGRPQLALLPPRGPVLPLLALLPPRGPVLPPAVQTSPPLEVLLLLPLPQELQASFPACRLPQADTPLALGCQDSFPLHRGSFLECTPLLLGLLRLPTPTCPTKGTCMAPEAPPLFLPPQGSLEERSHLYPLAHGARPQDPTEDPLLLEECCRSPDLHISDHHNEQRRASAPVPYDLPLHAGIMPRLLITIVGEPIPGGERFQVDFMKGADVVFHFNPRFSEQTIVRNSNLSGYWGPEEREGGFPFIPGRQFELKILVEEDVYKVAVDGAHILEYEHRAGGMEQVTLLRVCGDLTLYSIAPSII